MPEGESKQDKQATQAQARQVIDVFHEISTLLV
jgi:mitotic-spindle organizing protein 1